MNSLLKQQFESLEKQISALRDAVDGAARKQAENEASRKLILKQFWDAERRAGIYEETYRRLQGVLAENEQLKRQVSEARERARRILTLARDLSRKAEIT